MKITGNTILVTGGTSGIGRGLAEALHDRGNRVVVAARRTTLLDEIVAARPGMAAITLDLDDPASVAALRAEVTVRFPDLNMLIANAGISRTEQIAADDWGTADAEAMIRTNIVGVLRAVRAVLPLLKQQHEPAILATSSALAFVPRADFPTYSATKAFLHSWLQSLRHQLRHVPVEVIEIAPPYVRTAITGAAQAGDPRAMPVDDYVAEVIGLLESGAYPGGEVVLERDFARRRAERDGRYDAIFAALNPD